MAEQGAEGDTSGGPARSEQWQTFVENKLDQHRENRWVLRAASQKYERDVTYERDDDKWLSKVTEAKRMEQILESLSREHQITLDAGFFYTRNVRREVEGDKERSIKGSGEGSFARLEKRIGSRILIAGLTSTAIKGCVETGKEPLHWVVWLSELREVDKATLQRASKALTKIRDEKTALLRAALVPVAHAIGQHIPEREPEEKREPKDRSPTIGRFKLPSWAREMQEATR